MPETKYDLLPRKKFMEIFRILQEIDIEIVEYALDLNKRIHAEPFTDKLTPGAVLMNCISCMKSDLLFQRTGVDIEQWDYTL